MRCRLPAILLCAAGLLVVFTGCGTPTGGGASRQTQSGPRAELVLLNVPEASGWVAFADEEADATETEEYRIVVIRQATGEILYDSRVPLSTALRTHGFEMAGDDPRLVGIARQIEADIIAPVAEGDTPAPRAIPATPADNPLAALQVVSATESTLVLDQGDLNLLQVGTRLFVRTPAQTHTDPRTGEEILISRGEIVALMNVESVEGSRATARILSGDLPEEGYLELAPPDED